MISVPHEQGHMNGAIEMMGLAKEYSGKRVIDGLSLDVEKDEIFGFLGPNGAGKSTGRLSV